MLDGLMVLVTLWSAVETNVCQTSDLKSEVKEKTAKKVGASDTNPAQFILVDEPIFDDSLGGIYVFCDFKVHVYWSAYTEDCSVLCTYNKLENKMKSTKVQVCNLNNDPGANRWQKDPPRNGHPMQSPPPYATGGPTEKHRPQPTAQQLQATTGSPRQRRHSASPAPHRPAPAPPQSPTPKKRRPPPPPPPLKPNKRPNGIATGSPTATPGYGIQWPPMQIAATMSEPALHKRGGGGRGVSPTKGNRGRRASDPTPNQLRGQPSNGNQQRQRRWSNDALKRWSRWDQWGGRWLG